MGYPVRIGPFQGEVLLDREGLFRIVRFREGYVEEPVLKEVRQTAFVGVVLLNSEAFLLRTSWVLHTTWSEPWLQGLMRMVGSVDPLEAEEIAERVFLRRIFAQGLGGLLELKHKLGTIKKHARRAEIDSLRHGSFEKAMGWKLIQDEIQDIEARIRNLQLTLGRLAMRMGNRWLRGDEP